MNFKGELFKCMFMLERKDAVFKHGNSLVFADVQVRVFECIHNSYWFCGSIIFTHVKVKNTHSVNFF